MVWVELGEARQRGSQSFVVESGILSPFIHWSGFENRIGSLHFARDFEAQIDVSSALPSFVSLRIILVAKVFSRCWRTVDEDGYSILFESNLVPEDFIRKMSCRAH